jgi:hypothetical protein
MTMLIRELAPATSHEKGVILLADLPTEAVVAKMKLRV